MGPIFGMLWSGQNEVDRIYVFHIIWEVFLFPLDSCLHIEHNRIIVLRIFTILYRHIFSESVQFQLNLNWILVDAKIQKEKGTLTNDSGFVFR